MDKKKLLAELKTKKLALGKNMLEYKNKNAIEFIETPPNPGFNPKQAQVVEAFVDVALKIFGMSGGNRLGKCATISTLISTPDGEISIGDLLNNNKPFEVYAWD